MKILQCVPSIDPALGGSVEAPRLLTGALLRLGHAVEVLTIQQPRPEWSASWGAVIHFAGPAASYYHYSKHLVSWVTAHARNHDVFVIHGVWRYMSIGVWRGLRSSGVPYILYPHGMLDPFYNRFRWKRLKKVLMWRLVENKVLRDAAKVIFTCEEERRLSSANFHPFACNAAVLNLGIQSPPGAEPAASSWPPELAGKRVLLFLARIEPQKGVDTLISAFARVAPAHPGVHLLITGPDAIGWKAQLISLAASLGIAGRIVWHGPVFGAAKWDFFRRADAYVLPTNFENFGISIVEALACGLPVLISNKAAVWRDIEAAAAGLVSENTVDATAHMLERWLAFSCEQRDRFRHNALACFNEHYQIDRVAACFADLAESVIA